MRLFFTWVDRFHCALFWLCTSVCAGHALECFVGWHAFLHCIHELAHVYEFVSAYLIVAVEIHLCDVTFGELEVASTLGLGAIECTTL